MGTIQIDQDVLDSFKKTVAESQRREEEEKVSDVLKVFRKKDFDDNFNRVRDEAREIWRASSRKEFEENGDTGSCIMGDGFCVMAVPPRCRNAREVYIMRSSEVACCQGSLHYEKGVAEVKAHFAKNGYEVYYNHGRMD
jgi:hypothetical protein